MNEDHFKTRVKALDISSIPPERFAKVKNILRTIWRSWQVKKPRALPSRDFSPETTEYCWEDFYRDFKKNHPIRYVLQERIPRWYRVRIAMNIEQFFYWLRSHTYQKRHIIDSRSKENGYAWGWSEAGELILFSSFSILKEFVEQEMNNNYVVWEPDLAEEINLLYNWWTKDRPKLLDSEAYWSMGEEGSNIDDEMLTRLLKIRHHLWT